MRFLGRPLIASLLLVFCLALPVSGQATNYYYAANGQKQGPVSIEQVRQLVAAGTIKRDTLIWRPGLNEWQAAQNDPQVATLFAKQPPPVPQAGQTAMSSVVMKEHYVRDASRNGAPAFAVLVPQGWKTEGGITQVPAYSVLPYYGVFEMKAPDGRAVSFAPMFEFGYSDYARVPNFQPHKGRPFLRIPNSLGEFLVIAAQQDPEGKMTDIRIVSEELVEDATKMVRERNRPIYQMHQMESQKNAALGETWNYDIHVRRLVMQFTENGKRLESTVFATISHTAITLPNGSVKEAKWNIWDSYSVTGLINTEYTSDPVLAAIVRSWRPNPDWLYVIDQWQKGKRNQIYREGLAAAAAAQQAWSNTRGKQTEDVLDISFNGWKKREGIKDAGQAAVVNMIHEQTTYAKPGGGQVNLPSFYQNVYSNGQGTYVLHNDANYNINTDPMFNNFDWQKLPQVR